MSQEQGADQHGRDFRFPVTPPFQRVEAVVVECPKCGVRVEVERGGWPFVYTQIVLHLDDCSAALGPAQTSEIAARLAEEIAKRV